MIDVNSETWMAIKAKCERDIEEGQRVLESFDRSELEYAATRGAIGEARLILAMADAKPEPEEAPTEFVA